MSPDDQERERIAKAIADRQAVDWDRVVSDGILSAAEIEAFRALEMLRDAAGPPAAPDDDRPELAAPGSLANFELLRVIGRGATSVVWHARDRTLDREVALKCHDPEHPHDAPVWTRRLEEARLLAAIDHPNVVRIHSAGEADGQPFLTLEFVRGATLEQVCRELGPLAPGEAARIGADLCGALAALHGKGLVHRDIKPGNVMRERGGRVVLLDFSLVQPEQDQGADRALAGAGTPLFMAPEQFEGREPLGPATDVYGLGALLYWLVTLRHPSAGSTLAEIREHTVAGRTTPLLDVRPDVPRAFSAIVERALQRDPAARFPSMGHMQRELRRFSAYPDLAQPRWRRLAIAVCTAALLAPGIWLAREALARAEPVVATIESPEPQQGGRFPNCVATDAERVLVGQPLYDGPDGDDQGAAFVYRRDHGGWVLEQRLLGSAAAPKNRLGFAVSIRGDIAVVGEPNCLVEGVRAGAVEVFRLDAASGRWQLLQRLLAPTRSQTDLFGQSLAWDGDSLFVGSPSVSGGEQHPGVVHVFVWDGRSFTRVAELAAPDGRAGDQFGSVLAAADGLLAVGAEVADRAAGPDAGAVYTFHREGDAWRYEQSFPGTCAGARYGTSVAISSRFLAIGAPRCSTLGTTAGWVEVWTRAEAARRWVLPQAVISDGTDEIDAYGMDVLLVGEQLFVGSPYDESPVGIFGSVSRFAWQQGKWVEQTTMHCPNRHSSVFGGRLAHCARTLVISADGTRVGGVQDAGVAYVFEPVSDR